MEHRENSFTSCRIGSLFKVVSLRRTICNCGGSSMVKAWMVGGLTVVVSQEVPVARQVSAGPVRNSPGTFRTRLAFLHQQKANLYSGHHDDLKGPHKPWGTWVILDRMQRHHQ
jgi:hypothetical protein